MYQWVKDKIFPDPQRAPKSEYEQTADERPSKSEIKARKRFSREHGRRVRAREKELEKAWQGPRKFIVRGDCGAVPGGAAC
ncbi:hypothetical protein N7466_008472 [Penicillium verhagenii]|uniref:uncharacterized protein n=1 Tax=Penicillium verhagenii TaxID=1562060 RepID=UPI002545B987|nr:uncharacterized protein N7466_008472 [Penicillium verhagenii]KAJ5924285.1 hypothetical protein N7466_008472 [Penicillium verhagenii]